MTFDAVSIIEGMDKTVKNDYSGVSWGSSPDTRIYLDTDLFDEATYYHEAVAENSDGSNQTLNIRHSGDSNETGANIVVPGSTSVPTRLRSGSYTPNNTYKEKEQIGNSYHTVYVFRIVIVQASATKLELQIAFGSEASTKATSYANPSNWGHSVRKFWYYDSSKFSTSGSMTVEMEALLNSGGSSDTGYACVKLDGTTSALTNGEASVTGKTISRDRNTGGITLSNGNEYEADVRSSASNKSAYVYAVRLIIRMTATVSKFETVMRVGWEFSQNGLQQTYHDDERRIKWEEDYTDTPTVYVEGTGYEDSLAYSHAGIKDDGTDDSGTSTTSEATINNAIGPPPDRDRTLVTTLTDDNRYYGFGYVNGASDYYMYQGNVWIIVQVDASAGPVLKEVTDTLSLSDAVYVHKTIPITDTLSLADLIYAMKTIPITDTISLADVVKLPTRTIIISDSSGLSDQVYVHKTLPIADTIGLSDLIYALKTIPITDTVSLSDIIKLPTRTVVIAETTSLADALYVHKTLPITDTVGLADAIFTHKVIPMTDTISLSDEVDVGKLISILDTLSLSDQVYVNKTVVLTDSVDLADAVLLPDRTIIVSETVDLSDSVYLHATFVITDQVSLADAIYSDKNLTITEAISLADAVYTDKALFIVDAIGLSDAVYTHKVIPMTDTVDLADEVLVDKDVVVLDTVDLSDYIDVVKEVLAKVVKDNIYLTDVAYKEPWVIFVKLQGLKRIKRVKGLKRDIDLIGLKRDIKIDGLTRNIEIQGKRRKIKLERLDRRD